MGLNVVSSLFCFPLLLYLHPRFVSEKITFNLFFSVKIFVTFLFIWASEAVHSYKKSDTINKGILNIIKEICLKYNTKHRTRLITESVHSTQNPCSLSKEAPFQVGALYI